MTQHTDLARPAQPSPSGRTYAEHVASYALAGWPCVLPVPPATKTPPPTGFTGEAGRDTEPADLVRFVGEHPGHSIALRMPAGIIGIDVDQYVKAGTQKRGAETLAHFVGLWGPLPPTWTSTARGPGQPSRIHFYAVPDQRYATRLATGLAEGTGDIEVIQRHHRYAVVAPSPHESAGAPYAWYSPDGSLSARPPAPGELPGLPPAWVEGLAAGASVAGPASADRASGEGLLDQLLGDYRPECAEITSARLTAVEAVTAAKESTRHDVATERAHHLMQLAAHGHTGVARAVLELREAWDAVTAGEDRGDELERMLLTSARKAVTAVGVVQVPNDPCLFGGLGAGLMAVPSPTPGGAGEGGSTAGSDTEGPDASAAAPIEPPRWYSVRQFMGAEAFDPNAGHDQALAEKVLERTHPVLRHTYDTGGWLLRLPDRWESHGSLAGWAVAQVANLMPVGDSTADKESEAYARSRRRTRLMSTAGARAVAGKMTDLVAGGTHPAALRLADLDADPEIMWAGGMAWSLRASSAGPALARNDQADPATPHLHAAGVTPEVRPTPLWDAFLAAVWPDPELRAWALRVLAITLTGYADRALPILLGETGRGKTQVVHLLMSVLGSYSHAANPKLLSAGSNEHDTIVYALKGRRLSFIDEAPSEAKVGQERLKQLTGGGELTARQMNQDPITFAPTHTFVLTANDEPLLTDPAVRSRARLIPCEGDPEAVRATRAALGHVSGAAWRTEAPGVLAALMREAAAWLADPTTASTAAAPERIRYLAEHLGAEQDPVAVWLAEETEPHEAGTPSRELYQAFTASCLRNNLRRDAIPSETKWGRALTRHGYPSVNTFQGKRRALKVRTGGGFLPGMDPNPPTQAVQQTPQQSTNGAGGLTPNPGGLLAGSNANPPAPFPQVNPSDQPNNGGLAGSHTPYAHAQAGAPAGGSDPDSSSTRQPSEPETGVDLQEQPSGGLRRPTGEPKRKPKDPVKEAAAAEKRATIAAEKRAAAVAEASGQTLSLPAVLTADGTVRAIDTATADQLLATITGQAGDGTLTVDVEHTGYPIGHRDYRLRTVQLGGEVFALVLDPEVPDQADVVRRHLEAARVLHAHSATADLVPLATAGLVEAESAWAKMLDTGLLAKLADPASTGNDADLKSLAKNVLGPRALSPSADAERARLYKAGKWLTDVEVTTSVERSGWAQSDPASTTMLRYAAADVIDDAALARALPRPAPHVLDRERTVQQMTARVTHRGIRLDGDHVERLLTEHREARAAHAEQVRAFGVENPGSNPQLAEAFTALGAALPRTPAGKPSVARGVIEPMAGPTAPDGPVKDLARTVLDYRHHNTALVLLLEPYHELVVRGDGRARPTVYTLGADTGRMSSSRPNVQQVSREGGMRACFTADPGHLLVSADFAGVELRVAAGLSGDSDLASLMADPTRDLHWEVARLAFGPQATKAQRYAVKRGVFGRIYGGGVGAVARGVGVSEPVARQVIDAMDALTPGLAEWSRMVREGVEAGRVHFPTYAGRVIHLPTAAPHAAPNYCIQGTARELLVDALLRWRETPWGGATLFPVHDELVVQVPEDQAAEATAALEACMTTELHGVPIVAEASEPTYAWADSA